MSGPSKADDNGDDEESESHIIDATPDNAAGQRQVDGNLQLRVLRFDVNQDQAVLTLDFHHAASVELYARAAPDALVEVPQLNAVPLEQPRGDFGGGVQHCNVNGCLHDRLTDTCSEGLCQGSHECLLFVWSINYNCGLLHKG